MKNNRIAIVVLGLLLQTACLSKSKEQTTTVAEETENGFQQSQDVSNNQEETENFEVITLAGYTCGDNCYIEYYSEKTGNTKQTALCLADACGDWEIPGRLPDQVIGKRVRAQFSTAKQYDNSGTVMDNNFPAIIAFKGLDETISATNYSVPLKEGFYVLKDIECNNPPNAAWRYWTGKGLRGSATKNCELKIIENNKTHYTVSQSCTNTYNNSKSNELFTMTISDEQNFTISESASGTTASVQHFTFCNETPSWYTN